MTCCDGPSSSVPLPNLTLICVFAADPMPLESVRSPTPRHIASQGNSYATASIDLPVALQVGIYSNGQEDHIR